MKGIKEKFTTKQIILFLIGLISLLFFGGLTLWANLIKSSLPDQRVAQRWSEEGDYAQITCFFTAGTEVDRFTMLSFEEELKKELKSLNIEASNENARLYIDAYSNLGTITLVSEKTSVEADAVGVGGDFFQFHPLELVSGRYFSDSDVMQDWVVIDQDMAWQLFGSDDVAGQSVTIGGIPHIIAGVVKREEGRFNEAAGLDDTMVYVSADTLTNLGKTQGISTFELLAPNPMTGYVYNLVKEKFGLKEDVMVVIENTTRFKLKGLLTVVSEFGTRSMQMRELQYPYWENVARAWEDVLAFILIFQFITLMVPGVLVVVAVISTYRNRTWTARTVMLKLIDTKDNIVQKCRNEKNKWKHF